MKRSTVPLILALALAVGYAAYLQWEVSQLRDAVAAAVHDAPPSPSSFAEPPQRGAPDGASLGGGVGAATTGGAVVEAAVAETARSGEPEQRPADWQERRRARQERFLAAFEDPEMRLDMVERQMERIDSQFGDFFRIANLSPEQVDVLRAVLAEREVSRWEERVNAFSLENEAARDALREEMDAKRLALTAEVAVMLGEEGMQQFEFYEESLPFRREVDQFASSLSYTNTPLSDSQTEALIARLAEANSNFEYTNDLSEMRRGGWDEVDPQDVATYFAERAERDDLLIANARGVLEEDQLRAFAERRYAERERDRREMEFRLQGQREAD